MRQERAIGKLQDRLQTSRAEFVAKREIDQMEIANLRERLTLQEEGGMVELRTLLEGIGTHPGRGTRRRVSGFCACACV